MLDKIFRVGHDCFRFEGEVVVYTDPFHLPEGLPKADIVLLSHEHYDHCSPEDLAKITTPQTTFVAPQSCRASLEGEVIVVKPGDKINIKAVPIEVVPAYNTNKKFHPKQAGHVGYVFTLGGQRIYFAGDTDLIPEMGNIHCDIALLPVSGTYVMTADEAVGAALKINPKVVIPMHYGDIVGSEKDAETFRMMFKGTTVIK